LPVPPMETLVQKLQLGDSVRMDGAVAMVLLDPEKVDREMVEAGGNMGVRFDLDPSSYPMAAILPVKDLQDISKTATFVRDGKYVKVVRKGGSKNDPAISWGLRLGKKYLAVATKKKWLNAFPGNGKFLPRMTAGQEKMIQRDHGWAWIDLKRMKQLHSRNVAPKLPGMGYGMRTMMYAMPIGPPLLWVTMTRESWMTQADHVAVSVHSSADGIRFETRLGYGRKSPFRKALAAAKPISKPRTILQGLPGLDGLFYYGSNKTLRTPMEMKKQDYANLLGHPVLADLPKEVRDTLLKSVESIQGQVTGVKHFCGPSKANNGSLAFGTIVKCKDSATLRKTIHTAADRAGAAMKKLTENSSTKVRLTINKDVIAVGSLTGDRIQFDGTMFQGEELSKSLETAIGDDRPSFSIIPLDKKRLLVTFMGGEDFIKTAVAAARADKVPDGLPKKHYDRIVRRLPGNRVTELFIYPSRAGNLYIDIGNRIMPNSGMDNVVFPPSPPVAASLSADKGELVIVAFVPAEVPKAITSFYLGMMMRH
ncbi:MAG: hypothetical protein ACLFVU_10850, partial [Phycisphaerae bacterium]